MLKVKNGGWHQADFTLGTGMAWPKPALRHATQIKACCHHQKGKGGFKYANLQDKYILILLEYKLMPQLKDWTLYSIGAKDPFSLQYFNKRGGGLAPSEIWWKKTAWKNELSPELITCRVGALHLRRKWEKEYTPAVYSANCAKALMCVGNEHLVEE